MESYIDAFKKDVSTGECQTVEFKSDFPDNARVVGEVIAAFATTNQGTIYLGVDDAGTVVGVRGIMDARDQAGRNEYQTRIQGVTRSLVDPPIIVRVNFIEHEGKIVVQVIVPKGNEPVYYCSGIPYVRDLSSTRKATATEVKELYRKFFAGQVLSQEASAEEIFSLRVLNQLSDVFLIAMDYRDHIISPDLDQMQSDLGQTGRIILELSSRPEAQQIGVQPQLREISNFLDDLGTFRFTLGPDSLNSFGAKLEEARKTADTIFQQLRKRLIGTAIADFDTVVLSGVEILRSEWQRREKYQERGDIELLRGTFHTLAFRFYDLGLTPYAERLGLDTGLRDLGVKLRNVSSYQKYFTRYSGLQRLEAPMTEILEIAKNLSENLARRSVNDRHF